MRFPGAKEKEKVSGTQGGVPTTLRLRQVGAEMQANKQIGDLQVQVNRQIAAVTLIQALGGGWQAGWMDGTAQAQPAASSTTQ